MKWCQGGIIYAHEFGWSGHFSIIDAKNASVLVPEKRARDADGMQMPLIWCSRARPTHEGGLAVLLDYLVSGGLNPTGG